MAHLARITTRHMASTPDHDVTALLHAWSEGDLDARDQLMPLVYDELRRRAAACMRRERQVHCLSSRYLL
jgi:RNA polymerase sigma-70 factor, ECF subfamily